MFFLFSKKPILKEIIPSQAVDFHSHLLHGIDDGAQTPEDTKFLLEQMAQLGFDQLITTPHTTPMVWDNTKEKITQRHQEVVQQFPELTSAVKLGVASEYMMDDSFVERFKKEPLLPIKGNEVLVEMSYMNPPINLFDILFQLQSKGYQPVLAHPERYNFYHNDYAAFHKLKEVGCTLQLNFLSVTGYYGPGIAAMAEKLLREGLYDYVATDVHHKKHIQAFSSKIQIKKFEIIEKLFENNEKFR